jgi:hypothetical protein
VRYYNGIVILVLGVTAGLLITALLRDTLPRARVWFAFALSLAGLGKMTSAAQHVSDWIDKTGSHATNWLWGIGAGIVVATVVGAEIWYVAGRRGPGGRRWAHTALAVLAPWLLISGISVAAVLIGFGATAPTTIVHGINCLL